MQFSVSYIIFCLIVEANFNAMDIGNRYVLERDPNIGFGFNLCLRGERYFIQSLSPEGPAKKAGLFEYAWVQELNSISITGHSPQNVISFSFFICLSFNVSLILTYLGRIYY